MSPAAREIRTPDQRLRVCGILAGPDADAFETARPRGRHLHVDDAVAYTLHRNDT